MKFEDVIQFHGHCCPGLATGFRVAKLAVKELQFERDVDEDLVAIVENSSCAVDAVQMIAGCTFGKGNLIFNDYGKPVYIFIKRPAGQSLRICVTWQAPPEDSATSTAWQKYVNGDLSQEVVELVHARKAAKIRAILAAKDDELFTVTKSISELPPRAKIFPFLTCDGCQEKVMEPRTMQVSGKILCIPCNNVAIHNMNSVP